VSFAKYANVMSVRFIPEIQFGWYMFSMKFVCASLFLEILIIVFVLVGIASLALGSLCD
jgi:hypothetical protein